MSTHFKTTFLALAALLSLLTIPTIAHAGTVADYIVLRDVDRTIESGGRVRWQQNFTMPAATKLNESMFLQWFMVSGTNARNLQYRFSINDNVIRTIVVTGNHFATIHEALPGNNLRIGRNRIEVRVVGGSGSVTLSDIILHFQRKP